MRLRISARHLVALGLVLALVAAACGDDDVVDTTTTAPPAETTTTTAPEPPDDFEAIPLTIGTLLPQTGGLAAIIDALEEPIRMGAAEINADFPGLITLVHADSGTDPVVASENVDQFLTGAFNAIIGAASSRVTLGIVDKVQEAGVVMCSGSNTGSALSEFMPYYVRTAPHDELQSQALGDLIIGDGHTEVAVTWRADIYGEGFGQDLADYLEASGITVVYRSSYDFEAASFVELIDAIVATGPTALAIITFDEGGQMVLDMQGRFDGQVYVADGFVDTVGADQLGGAVELLEGFRGTVPAYAPVLGEPTFSDRFGTFAPGAPTVFSAHYYDCLIVVALAAQEAQSSDPRVFVDFIVPITGPPGVKCSFFSECFALLAAGQQIDYEGASGPLDFLPNGEPGSGTYDLYEFDDQGNAVNFEQVLLSG